MGMRTAKILICDNAECGEEEEVDFEGVTATSGYHLGKGSWATGAGGGPIPKTYACSIECLAAAVEHNIQRALGRNPITGQPE
jgi:hypothetical protein